jgi:hypothetical protein
MLAHKVNIMNKTVAWLVALLLIVAGGVLVLYPRLVSERAPAAAEPVAAAPSVTEAPGEPQIRYPLPQRPLPVQPVASDGPAQPPQEALPPLPKLDESDPTVEKALFEVLGQQPALPFVLEQFVRRLVVTVDNLPQSQLPLRYLPTKPLGGPVRTTGEDEELFLSPSNYPRYVEHVEFFEQLDTGALVGAYVRFYPLFQEAYRELGYPDAYFNDRLIEVIDHLLATPQLKGPIRLVQPSVMHKYADPRLEGLSAGQKLLVRMGPQNAGRVKAKLGDLRETLLLQVAAAEAE